ncbi:MAG TPA: hypothetical protein GX525_09215 [Bacilli bacterium]|nr:hypothetical protein [Bacilli bacterium]
MAKDKSNKDIIQESYEKPNFKDPSHEQASYDKPSFTHEEQQPPQVKPKK